MTADDFRALALSLPETFEKLHFGQPAFYVGKKLFTSLSEDETEAIVKVCEPGRREALLETQGAFFMPPQSYARSQGLIGIRLATADPLLVRELLTDSWAAVATKRAQAALARQLEDRA